MKNLRHNIDLTAPGGLDKLFAFNRALFGDAQMNAGEGGTTTTTETSTTDTSSNADTSTSTTDEDGLGDAGKRALQAERDARAAEKRRADAAEAELQKIRDKDLSEAERARREAEASRTETENLKLENARLRAIAAHNVPADYQDLVAGKDEASYLASAEKIAKLAAKAEGKPDPVPGSGQRGNGGGNEQHESQKTGGSLAAGSDRYKARHPQKK